MVGSVLSRTTTRAARPFTAIVCVVSAAAVVLGMTGCGTGGTAERRLPTLAEQIFGATEPELRGIPTQSIDEAATALEESVSEVVVNLRSSNTAMSAGWAAVRQQTTEDEAAVIVGPICAVTVDDAFSEQPSDLLALFDAVTKRIDDSDSLRQRYLGMRDDAALMADHVRDATENDFTGLTTALAVDAFTTAYCPD